MNPFWQWQVSNPETGGEWAPLAGLSPVLSEEAAEVTRAVAVAYSEGTGRPVRLVRYDRCEVVETYGRSG